jgi:WD40 repeat protein
MKSTKTIIDSSTGLIQLQLFQGHSGPIYDIDFDKEFVYSAAADRFVTRWNKSTGEQDAFAIRCEAVPFSLKLFSKGQKIAIGLASGQINIVDVLQRRETHHFTQHQVGIFAMFETDDQRLLCVGDADGFLSIWETSSMKLLIILPLSCGKIRSIRQLNATSLLIAGGTGEVLVLETEFFNELHRFYAHEAGTSVLCIDDKRNELITGGKDGYLRWWDKETFALKKALPAHKGTIYGLQFIDQDVGLEDIVSHRHERHVFAPGDAGRVFRLLDELMDAVVCVSTHDAEAGGVTGVHRECGDGQVRFTGDVLAHDFAEVHAVELVATEDEEVIMPAFEEVAQILPHGIGGTLKPSWIIRRLFGG